MSEGDRATKVKAIKRKRMIYLCVSVAALLVLGLVYAWSIFAVPLGNAFGWDRASLSLVFSISMASFCIGCLAGSGIARWKSINVAIFIAAVLQAAGFLLTSLFASQGIWALYLFYGVFAGFGCGIGYNTIVSSVNLWFPDRIGLSSGVLMMGYGLGSLVLGTTASFVIETLGWSTAFILIAIAGFIALVALGIFLRLPPDDIEETMGTSQRKKKGTVPVQAEKRSMLKSPLFYLYFIWATLIIAATLSLIGDSKQGALTLNIDVTLATLLVGFVSLSNGLGRVVAGLVFDRFSLKGSIMLTSILGVISMSLLALSFANSLSGLYYVAALLAGFCGGSLPVNASSFVRERYGARFYPRNLAIVNLAVGVGAFLSSAIIALGRSFGGDQTVYTIFAAIMIATFFGGLAFLYFYFKQPSNQQRTASDVR